MAGEEVPTRALELLSVTSQPSGAAVEVDGGYVGKTPLVLRHSFERRAHRLRVLAEGHLPWERLVEPDPRLGTISVTAILEPRAER
jgi:hypothetical protein